MNKVTLIGRVGGDPEFMITQNSQLCKFSLATNKGRGETDWHRVTIWGKAAEVARDYVKKGDQTCVIGRIEYGQYEKDGNTVNTTDIHCYEIELLSNVRQSTEEASEDDMP